MPDESRLIWYIHLHKAGGSSFIELAQRNGEVLYPRHANGNPVDENGKGIRLWELGRDGLRRFVDETTARGVSFVASEWGVPDLAALRDDPRVVTVAIFRNPVVRLMSNFVYDYKRGYTKARTLSEYVSDNFRPYAQHNFYTRQLLRGRYQSDLPEAQILEQALAQCALIDYPLVLESDGVWTRVARGLGWTPFDVHANRSDGVRVAARVAAQNLQHGRMDVLVKAFRTPAISDAERANLFASNIVDQQLYEAVERDDASLVS